MRASLTPCIAPPPPPLIVQELLSFVRRATESLGDWDLWGSGFSAWPDVMWKRSAGQFLGELALGPEAGVCPSVTERLAR